MNSQEYYDWLNKFEKRNTSDDTFTPPQVYDAVLDYVHNNVINLDGMTVVRPFYPDGDYQAAAQDYDDNTVVIDNPPFSILSKIIDFYCQNNIKFFLFAPALTVFTTTRGRPATVIISETTITYDNGAKVRSCFVSNLFGDLIAKTAPTLAKTLKQIDDENKVGLPKWQYPNAVMTINRLQKITAKGVDFEISRQECQFISRLDSQKEHKKGLFGGGFLISHKKAKELEAKELEAKNKVFTWQLSEREQATINQLG